MVIAFSLSTIPTTLSCYQEDEQEAILKAHGIGAKVKVDGA